MYDPRSDIVEIPEYNALELVLKNEAQELSYLQSDCFRKKGVSPYKISMVRNDKVKIENSSFSGIIQLNDIRIHFSTKVKTNLFYMLTFLRDEENFCYDPLRIIDIEEGANFFDILGRLFANELNAIFKRGICKRYVRKEENLRFLKGRLLISQQVRNNVRKQTKFSCLYDDLTYDSLENRIVLRATSLLVPRIRFNDVVKRDLFRYMNMLREEVSLEAVVPEDCNKVQYSRINDYYEAIIEFCKIILQDHFIRSVHKGASRGFNFIVNMNQVYEDFITEMIIEVFREEEKLREYVVETQEKFDSLVKEKKIITKPDILLRRKNTREYPFIIDAKYKRQENNADYYQVIAYALAIPSATACFLVYPSEEKIEDSVVTVDTTPFQIQKPGREITIVALKINLHWDQVLDYKPYIQGVKKELKEKLLDIIVKGETNDKGSTW